MSEFGNLVEAISKTPVDRLGRKNPQIGRMIFYTRRIELYLTEEDYIRLNKHSKRTGKTRPELIRTALEWMYENEK